MGEVVVNCATCGYASPERAKFCPECGAALAPRCANCGAELTPAAKFCAECGTALTHPSSSNVAAGFKPAATSRSPNAYTPRHLAEKILNSRSALEGERKQVTVLFADVKGSMELAELAARDVRLPRRAAPTRRDAARRTQGSRRRRALLAAGAGARARGTLVGAAHGVALALGPLDAGLMDRV
jgi:hypothetical protein